MKESDHPTLCCDGKCPFSHVILVICLWIHLYHYNPSKEGSNKDGDYVFLETEIYQRPVGVWCYILACAEHEIPQETTDSRPLIFV